MARYRTRAVVSPAIFVGVAAMLGCATPAPILYPNAHLEKAGEAQSKRDIAYCETLANEYVQNPDEVKKTAVSGLGGAAGGAALGAIGGAIAGNAGQGAAIGAAVGAAAGILSSMSQSDTPDPNFEAFVDHCLARHGYEVIGWQ